MALLFSCRPASAQGPPLLYDVKADAVFKELSPAFCWFHPRAGAIPGQGKAGRPAVVMTIQKHLIAADHHSGLVGRCGRMTWGRRDRSPEEIRARLAEPGEQRSRSVGRRCHPGGSPQRKLVAIGIQVRYSQQGEHLFDKPRSHDFAYAMYDPRTDEWPSGGTCVAIPETGGKFHTLAPGCVQWHGQGGRHAVDSAVLQRARRAAIINLTVLHLGFNGDTFTYLEHGNRTEDRGARGYV